MGVAENVARFVLAADNLVNALADVAPNAPVGISMAKDDDGEFGTVRTARAQRREMRIRGAYTEYNDAREALVGPIDADEPEEPHNPL